MTPSRRNQHQRTYMQRCNTSTTEWIEVSRQLFQATAVRLARKVLIVCGFMFEPFVKLIFHKRYPLCYPSLLSFLRPASQIVQLFFACASLLEACWARQGPKHAVCILFYRADAHLRMRPPAVACTAGRMQEHWRVQRQWQKRHRRQQVSMVIADCSNCSSRAHGEMCGRGDSTGSLVAVCSSFFEQYNGQGQEHGAWRRWQS
jgi:hypothetical protein